MKKNFRIVKLILSITLTVGTGAVTAYLTKDDVNGAWYHSLNRPSFNPPSALFGPIWTLLYILMGIAMYIIWTTEDSYAKRRGLMIYFAQLFLNGAWSILFFKEHLIFTALIDIVLLLCLIFLMIRWFARISKTAARLNYPYLIWICFATLLNVSFYFLNG